ncbi:MAG: type I-C CRISPR-associated protein Cas5 [Desulfobacterales bacterium]|uniref:pre-crRNA processing endonuclease n=1 Tax=Candidatus Desulfatibia vada TaxID=2841696 RepID=A0A8J6TLT2_9BACT|nr:type I-C CRISPR-associated protein Cas5 [Candidatus Desulfatibia vada]
MKGFCLEVKGSYACFTRPEMKVERVSYDVITPSAARAVYDAILWKPAIFWRVTRIEVLAPIRWISVRRNEVGAVASTKKRHIFVEDNRQQRAGLFLRDVKYRLFAEFEFIPPEKRGKVYNPVPDYLHDMEELEIVRQDEKPAKYAAMFERRASKGQCFNQPYLGCREFSAQFRLVDPQVEPASPISETRDLGWMLYDMDYSDPSNIKPQFFRAKLSYGVLNLGNVEVRS